MCVQQLGGTGLDTETASEIAATIIFSTADSRKNLRPSFLMVEECFLFLRKKGLDKLTPKEAAEITQLLTPIVPKLVKIVERINGG